MMKSEIYWYNIMREQTNIKVPKVYFEDYSKSIIPTNYFVMEKLEGVQKNKMKFTKEEKINANAETSKMVASIHKVHNDKFGYIQSGLYDTWFEAYQHIVSDLISDCEKFGKTSKLGINY